MKSESRLRVGKEETAVWEKGDDASCSSATPRFTCKHGLDCTLCGQEKKDRTDSLEVLFVSVEDLVDVVALEDGQRLVLGGDEPREVLLDLGHRRVQLRVLATLLEGRRQVVAVRVEMRRLRRQRLHVVGTDGGREGEVRVEVLHLLFLLSHQVWLSRHLRNMDSGQGAVDAHRLLEVMRRRRKMDDGARGDRYCRVSTASAQISALARVLPVLRQLLL